MLGLALAGYAPDGVGDGVGDATCLIWTVGFLAALALYLPASVVPAAPRAASELPSAFPSDLRHAFAGPRAAAASERSSGAAGASSATRAPGEASRHAAVLAQTRARLRAFEEALDAARDVLPDTALRDLRATARELGEQVGVLGRRVDALVADLARLDAGAEAAAVAEIETRLEGLRTPPPAGDDEVSGEITELEQALAAHRDLVDHAERIRGRLTVLVARLLETGAAAERARLELTSEPEPARSVDGLLSRLKQQTEDAPEALAEIDAVPLPREPLGAADRRRRPVEERS